MKKRKLLTLILLGALLGVNLNINAMQKRTQPDNPSGQSRRQEKRPRTESQEAQSPLLQRVRNVGLGNTRTNCYLNASIQCLSSLTGFRENLLRNEDLYKNDPVISKLIRVIKNLRISEHSITDLDFINSVVDLMQSQPGNERRRFQDAQEFISLIIARLYEINPAATQSLSMCTANQFKCLSCGHEHASRIDNESGALKLDLTDQPQTLEQLLNKDFAEIQLDDDYLCDGCGLQKTTKTTKKISQYPNELMITFNRLDFDVQTQREKPKNNTPIRFPKNLNLRPYATEELQQQEVDSSYELCGIICHESRGIQHYYSQHYYSYVKDFSDGKWRLYNDDSVDFVRDQDIQKVMANSPLPCVLFYKLKVDGDDEVAPIIEDVEEKLEYKAEQKTGWFQTFTGLFSRGQKPIEQMEKESIDTADCDDEESYKGSIGFNEHNFEILKKRLKRSYVKFEQLCKQQKDPLRKIILEKYLPVLKKRRLNLDALQKASATLPDFSSAFQDIQKQINANNINSILQKLREHEVENKILDRSIYLNAKVQDLLQRDYSSLDDYFSDSSDSEAEDKKASKNQSPFQKYEIFMQAIGNEKNLVGIDLSGQDLSDVNLSGKDFTGANFKNAILKNANFKGSNLTDAIFEGAIFENTDLSETNITRVNFTNVAHWNNVKMDGIKELAGTNLSGFNLQRIKFAESASLTDAILIGADLSKSNFKGAIFRNTNLRNSIFNGTNLDDASFINADLSGAVLNGADVFRVKITEHSKLVGTKLSNMHFYDAHITDVAFYEELAPNSFLQKLIFEKCHFNNVDMTKIQASIIKFVATRLENIKFNHSYMEHICVKDAGIIGKKLDFTRAIIIKSYFLGDVLDNWDCRHHEELRTPGIDIQYETVICKHPVKTSASILLLLVLSGEKYVTPLFSYGMANSWGGCRQIFNYENVNSYIEDSNFSFATLQDVCFMNIKFKGNTSFKEISSASKSVFENVIINDFKKSFIEKFLAGDAFSVIDPNSEVGKLLRSGAKVNDRVDPDRSGEWLNQPTLVEKIDSILRVVETVGTIARTAAMFA